MIDLKTIKEFGIIILFLFLGGIVKSLFDFPIPDTVYGMILLFIALCLKVVKLEDVENTADRLIGLISLFLVPSSVAFITIYKEVQNDILKIMLLVAISTLITMLTTAKTI